MIQLTLLVAPIFLVILLGYLLRRSLVSDDVVWDYINKLAYWVLFPCLLFNKTSVIDFGSFELLPLAVTVMAGPLVAGVFCFIFSKFAIKSVASITSVLQGGMRHNAFVALAVVTQLYGDEGAMIAAIIIAVLVTFTNILVNIMMTVLLSPKGGGMAGVVADLKRNPFIIAISLGAIFNVMGWGNLPILHQFTLSIGETTLTIALLCVGAGLRLRGLDGNISACVISSVGKFIIFPLSVFLLARTFALSDILTVAVMIFAVSPTGAASYPLARQMGGDAPLMATLISLQTLMAIVIIPLTIYLLR